LISVGRIQRTFVLNFQKNYHFAIYIIPGTNKNRKGFEEGRGKMCGGGGQVGWGTRVTCPNLLFSKKNAF
jgi:hypothetical protein